MTGMLVPLYAARAAEEVFFGPQEVTLSTSYEVSSVLSLHEATQQYSCADFLQTQHIRWRFVQLILAICMLQCHQGGGKTRAVDKSCVACLCKAIKVLSFCHSVNPER